MRNANGPDTPAAQDLAITSAIELDRGRLWRFIRRRVPDLVNKHGDGRHTPLRCARRMADQPARRPFHRSREEIVSGNRAPQCAEECLPRRRPLRHRIPCRSRLGGLLDHYKRAA